MDNASKTRIQGINRYTVKPSETERVHINKNGKSAVFPYPVSVSATAPKFETNRGFLSVLRLRAAAQFSATEDFPVSQAEPLSTVSHRKPWNNRSSARRPFRMTHGNGTTIGEEETRFDLQSWLGFMDDSQ